jgi:hypothetical protein
MSLGWRHPHKTALLAALFLLGAVVACAVVCHAERGRWRPQADDTRVPLPLVCSSAAGRLAVPGIPGWARRGLKDGGAGETIGGIPGALGTGAPVGFPRCPAGLTGCALLLFLTSPPRMLLDGGVRSGTVYAAPFAGPGRPAGHPRAARVHSVRTSGRCAVWGLYQRCAGRYSETPVPERSSIARENEEDGGPCLLTASIASTILS